MELNRLLEKIKDDAKKTASEIIENANKKSMELIKTKEEKFHKKAENLKADAPSQAKEIYERILSDANINARKEILLKKRELIDVAFSKAYEKLSDLSLEQYKNLLLKKANEINEKAEVSVIEKFDKNITDTFLKSVNPLLTKSKKTVNSGFCFSMENSRINYDFSEVIHRIKEQKDNEISNMLFS